MITIGGTTRIGKGGFQTTGSIDINGVKIDFRDRIGTCRRILARVSDEEKLEFANSIIEEIKGNGGPKKSDKSKVKEIRCEGQQFTSIENSSNCTVYLKQSENNCVTIEGKKVDVDKIHTSVSQGVLKLEVDEDEYFNLPPVIYVECPVISNISTDGSSDVELQSPIVSKYDNLCIFIMGSGNVKCLEVDVPGIDIDITASGKVDIENIKTCSIMASITGSGDIIFEDSVISSSAKLVVQGSGDIELNGSVRSISASVAGSGDIKGYVNCDMINARVAGSGDIRFTGNIKSKTQRVAGSGSIIIN